MRVCLLLLALSLAACGGDGGSSSQSEKSVGEPEGSTEVSSNEEDTTKGLGGTDVDTPAKDPDEESVDRGIRLSNQLVGLWKSDNHMLGLIGSACDVEGAENQGFVEITEDGNATVYDYMDDECVRAFQCYWQSESYVVDETISDTEITLRVKGGVRPLLKVVIEPGDNGNTSFTVTRLDVVNETRYEYRREEAITAIDLSPNCRDTVLPEKDSFDTLRDLLVEVKEAGNGTLNDYRCPNILEDLMPYSGVDGFAIYTERQLDQPFSLMSWSQYAVDLMTNGEVHQLSFGMALNRSVTPYKWCIFDISRGHG